MDNLEQKHFQILKDVFEKINNPHIKAELNLKTDSDTDTEIFIRTKTLRLYSFRVNHRDGTFYDRYGKGFRKSLFDTAQDLLNHINGIR